MNPIQSCLQIASERKGQEILLNSSQPVRLRVGKQIQTLNSADLSANELRTMVSQVLTDEERKTLFENFRVKGLKTIGAISFKFDFQIDFEGINGSLVLQDQKSAAWNFPAIVSELVSKSHGLSIVTGPRRSGKTAAVAQLLHSIQSRNKVIAIYTDDESHLFESPGNVVATYPTEQLKSKGVSPSADLVVIDSAQLSFCETALKLAEEGRSVVLTLSFWNVSMALQRMLDLSEGSEASRARRLGSVLQMCLGLRLLAGIETPMQGAFELLLADQEVQKAIFNQQLHLLTELMKNSAERTGMRSLNHTLFQLLMKRKIELKTAFEASSEPEELDVLLKKVGI